MNTYKATMTMADCYQQTTIENLVKNEAKQTDEKTMRDTVMRSEYAIIHALCREKRASLEFKNG